MSPVLALVLSAAGLAPQGSEPSLEEELAALIERTNRIETLHLVYEAESEVDGETEAMTVELVYRAPDFGRMRVTHPEGEFDQWLLGERVYVQREGRWERAELSSPPTALQLLAEHFPRERGALEPGVAFGIASRRKKDGGADFQLTCAAMRNGRDHLLGWLASLERASGVVAEGNELSLEEDGLRTVVRRDSGLLQEVGLHSDRGRVSFVLRQVSVDEPLASELVDLPEAARAAPESEELARAFGWALPAQRVMAFGRVETQLASGRREWNSLARGQWEEVLEGMHREALAQSQAAMIAKLRLSIPERAERAKRDRGEQDSPERKAWEEKVAEVRANLESSLAEAESRYRASIEALELTGVEPRQELLDVEAEVLTALWDELVRAPMLALFDESFAAAAR